MPFQPINLSKDLQSKLENFYKSYDFVELYKRYNWRNDNWGSGFKDILQLEIKIGKIARNNLLEKDDILSIVEWGDLRNKQRVKCPETIALPLFENEHPDKKIGEEPSNLITILQEKIEGLGPTYLSKVLRFALPSEFGSIDTRIVRVVGVGDNDYKRHDWLSLKVCNVGYGWYIPKNQSMWPKEYSKWLNILRFFAHLLDNSQRLCPHPQGFLENGLRKQPCWTCADVEMALFRYASECLN